MEIAAFTKSRDINNLQEYHTVSELTCCSLLEFVAQARIQTLEIKSATGVTIILNNRLAVRGDVTFGFLIAMGSVSNMFLEA